MKDPSRPDLPPVLSVSQLNRLARGLLEDHFPAVLVEGEISNFAAPSSGHWYLTLKDGSAQVRCAMFRNRNLFVRKRPRDGMKVQVKGKLSLYEGRGDYQLILESLEETGAGALRREFELLKQRLAAEGLFDSARKRPLPGMPRHLAILTSPSGAAVHDVLRVLQRRFPLLRITLVPVSVQGQAAAGEIRAALDLVNRGQGCLQDVDLVLVTRGGGSLEDLWAFNDEALARAIHASRLPVISAVGHETDFSIADFVADLRAPTPSAAAEVLSPDQDAWLHRLAQQERRLTQLVRQHMATAHAGLMHTARRLQHPGRRLQEHGQRLDELETRLRRGIRNCLSLEGRHLHNLRQRLNPRLPREQVRFLRQRLQQLGDHLPRQVRRRLEQLRSSLQAQAHTLETVSPLATLARGYAIVTNENGNVVTRYSEVATGATIRTRLAEGTLVSVVTAGLDETAS